MFDGPILFHAFGIDWQLTKIFSVAGLLLVVLGIVLGAILALHTKARARRLSADEASEIAFNAASGHDHDRHIHGKAAGVGVEMSASIGSLRRAAQRGDWATFLLWPSVMSCCFVGLWLFFSAFLWNESKALWALMSVFVGGMECIALFMPWAALYTTIELTPPAEPGSVDPPQR